jgi:hypothetical protein
LYGNFVPNSVLFMKFNSVLTIGLLIISLLHKEI